MTVGLAVTLVQRADKQDVLPSMSPPHHARATGRVSSRPTPAPAPARSMSMSASGSGPGSGSRRAASFGEYGFSRLSRVSPPSASSDSWAPDAACGCTPPSSLSSLSTSASSLDAPEPSPAAPSAPSSRLAHKAREGLFGSPSGELLYGVRAPAPGPSLVRVYAARPASWINGDVEGVGPWFASLMLALGVRVTRHGARFRASPNSDSPFLAWMRGSLDVFRPQDDARCAHCRAHKVGNWRGTRVAAPCVVEAASVHGSPVPVSACFACRARGVPCDLYRGAQPEPGTEGKTKVRLEMDAEGLAEVLEACRAAVGVMHAVGRADTGATACQRAGLEGAARDLSWAIGRLEDSRRTKSKVSRL